VTGGSAEAGKKTTKSAMAYKGENERCFKLGDLWAGWASFAVSAFSI
jgi:hypothetical protein